MAVHTALRKEVQRTYVLEIGTIEIYRRLASSVRHRKVAALSTALADIAEAHALDMGTIASNEGWSVGFIGQDEIDLDLVEDWVLITDQAMQAAAASPEGDAAVLTLLLRICHMKIPSYDMGTMLATYSERPLALRLLRFCAEDERTSAQRILSLMESGVGTWAATGEIAFSAF